MTSSSERGYAENIDPPANWLDRTFAQLSGPIARRLSARRVTGGGFVQQVNRFDAWARNLADQEFARAASQVRGPLRRRDFPIGAVAQSFALVREAATRTLGQRHFDVQLIGGRILLDGLVAEMATGEGKTLTAT